jgi:hypothetical protein
MFPIPGDPAYEQEGQHWLVVHLCTHQSYLWLEMSLEVCAASPLRTKTRRKWSCHCQVNHLASRHAAGSPALLPPAEFGRWVRDSRTHGGREGQEGGPRGRARRPWGALEHCEGA